MTGYEGRHGRRWRRLTQELRQRHDPCWLCGMPIDYTATYPDNNSFTVDHKKSWIREDPANLAAAHARCNKTKGSNEAAPTLGYLTEQW
jgi:hypothetical protein